MKIEIKYGVDSEVWLLHSNKAVSTKVTNWMAKGYSPAKGEYKVSTLYHLKDEVTDKGLPQLTFSSAGYPESELFSSKEELLKSL